MFFDFSSKIFLFIDTSTVIKQMLIDKIVSGSANTFEVNFLEIRHV